jgi:CRP-like cAMP-binding protein
VGRIVERFPTAPLFRGLTPQEIARFLAEARNIEAAAGETVIREGVPGDGLYVIGAGAFEVVKGQGSERQVIARLEEMSAFGEMSLFDDAVRSASVVCAAPGRLKMIPRERFQALLDAGDPLANKITLNICRVLARRLAAIDDRLVS